MAPKRGATTKAGRAGAEGPARRLSACEVKGLIAQYSQSAFQPDTRDALRRDLNKAISDFQFRRSYAIAPTPAQFRTRFNGLHADLKRVKANLPPADRQDDLFEFIRRLGEAYASVHGPHPHIVPRELSSVRELGLEHEVDFNSAQRLCELIESVHQISCWMEDYDENLVPKVGWSMLEKRYGRTHSPKLWLIGKQLPKIFDKYFRHSKGGDRPKQLSDETYSRRDQFVVAVLKYAGIRSSKNKEYSAEVVEKYRNRSARAPEGFELTDNIEGFERADNLD
jgi:hypothetical protein